ncbi:DUF1508 domain-containing protein [Polaromonas sp. P1(28)-8]|nr:DUF1508 domain-containing protein [Polaromonas sp. P1(28)-8]
MAELRQAVGLRSLGSGAVAAPKHKAARTAAPAFKQYREKDGRFYFKLLDADARLLLQSQGFDSPRDAAQAIAALQKKALPHCPRSRTRSPPHPKFLPVTWLQLCIFSRLSRTEYRRRGDQDGQRGVAPHRLPDGRNRTLP